MSVIIIVIIGFLLLIGGLLFIHTFSMEQVEKTGKKVWSKHIDNSWNRAKRKTQMKQKTKDWATAYLESRKKQNKK